MKLVSRINVTLNALDWDGHQKTQLHTTHLGSGQVGLVATLNAAIDHDNTYVLLQFWCRRDGFDREESLRGTSVAPSENDRLIELPPGFCAHIRMAYEAAWDASLLTRG